LNEVVAIDLKSLWVVRIDPSELCPNLIDPLGVIDNVEAEFVEDIQINHLRVEVRPELNVIVGALLNLLVQLSIETLKGNHNGHIKLSEIPAILAGFPSSRATLPVLVD